MTQTSVSQGGQSLDVSEQIKDESRTSLSTVYPLSTHWLDEERPQCKRQNGDCDVAMRREIEHLTADRDSWKARIMHLTEVERDNERLRAALKTAQLRFEYIAAGIGRPTVDPTVGAKECAEALASHERETVPK